MDLLLSCGIILFMGPPVTNKMTHKSPSKIIRSRIRMTLFLSAKLRLPKPSSISSQSKLPTSVQKCLTRSKVSLTNYPSTCEVCQQHQCQYDDNHCLWFIIACAQYLYSSLDSMLENPLSNALKKPPDKET